MGGCRCGCPCRKNGSDRMASAVSYQKRRSVEVVHGSLGVQVLKARNLPRSSILTNGFFVVIEAYEGEDRSTGKLLGMGCTTIAHPGDVDEGDVGNHRLIQWNTIVSIPCQQGRMSKPSDVLPSLWNVGKTKLLISLCDQSKIDMTSSPLSVAGSIVVSLEELLVERELWVELFDDKGDALCAPDGRYKPCKLSLILQAKTIPDAWDYVQPPPQRSYPQHVFMMTRGTRGDVQPFVTLARGMAEQLGYLVTICTEIRWKSFVMQWSNVSNGRIQFCPSGGDTESQLDDPVAQFVTMSKSEMFQMLIMANTEANFFRSTTVFLDHVEEFEHIGDRPVDSLIFGLTVAGIAIMIGELLNKKVVGLVLQPSCIPSTEKDWTAVQSIYTHNLGLADVIEEQLFTGHSSLTTLKSIFESSVFNSWSLNALRKRFGLKSINTYEHLNKQNVPLIIPMKKDTFNRPADWWPSITLTDFIFLRAPTQPGKVGSLGEPLDDFIKQAKSGGGKIGLMTFSSMRVPRGTVLKLCTKMVLECKFNLSMIYVGKKFPDPIPADLQNKVDDLTAAKRLVILEKADFGELFKYPDLFIIQGGLGTTVEAGRVKKPVVVSGPLLLDQRFWGDVCHKKGIGPPATHIDNFKEIAVDYANGALDPADPEGWQKHAKEADWGNVEDDGVENNVIAFKRFLVEDEPTPGDALPPGENMVITPLNLTPLKITGKTSL